MSKRRSKKEKMNQIKVQQDIQDGCTVRVVSKQIKN